MNSKLRPKIAIVKIKKAIDKYFERIGRNEDIDTDTFRMDLIDEIEGIIDKTEMDNKILIAEELDED